VTESVFDFDMIVDRRGTDSEKWNRYEGRDIIPLWVADMDFCSPPAVIDALRERVSNGVFGYTHPSRELVEAVMAHLFRDFGWEISEEWLVWLPGLVCGLNVLCRAVGAGDRQGASDSIGRALDHRPGGAGTGDHAADQTFTPLQSPQSGWPCLEPH